MRINRITQKTKPTYTNGNGNETQESMLRIFYFWTLDALITDLMAVVLNMNVCVCVWMAL